MAAASLAAWASTLSGAVSLSAASLAHLRYFKRAPSTSSVVRSLFVEHDDPGPEAPAIATSTRSAAFASGLLLSGLTLGGSQFGQVGLGLGGDLHAFGEVLIAGGFLAGLGSQLAQTCTLSDSLQAPLQSRALVQTIAGLTTAAVTAALAHRLGRPYLYLDSSAALHSLDAMAIYDGPSMVAFTGAVLAFVAVKNQLGAGRSVKPVGVAFATGAGCGAGIGLLNLCDADRILSTLSGNAADPLLALGLGAAVLFNRIAAGRLVAAETIVSATTTSTRTAIIGSSFCGLGLGLTGLMPASAMVGLASGSASFWLFSASTLAGAGSVYLARGVRSYWATKVPPPAKSNAVN